MRTKMDALINAARGAVLHGPGKSLAELRQAIAQRAAAPPGEGPEVPDTVRAYVDKVAHAPYKVVDEDFAAMRGAGLSDDVIYEISVAAALGAAFERYRRGLAALSGRAP